MMNTDLPPYTPIFEEGSAVRIAERSVLEDFMKMWQYHHRLSPEQLPFAGTVATVESVGYYHGGDQIYRLSGVPGVWHPQCLRPA
jgi:hypothetical protein